MLYVLDINTDDEFLYYMRVCLKYHVYCEPVILSYERFFELNNNHILYYDKRSNHTFFSRLAYRNSEYINELTYFETLVIERTERWRIDDEE